MQRGSFDAGPVAGNTIRFPSDGPSNGGSKFKETEKQLDVNVELTERDRKPKLVRIIGRLVGGPARQACLLHEKLSASFDTYLVIGSASTGEYEMEYLLSDRNVFRISTMHREISFWSDIVAFWTIFKLLRKLRPNVVHTHTAKAGAIGRLAAWLTGVPVIVHTYHGHVFHGYFGKARSRLFLSIERMVGWVTTQIIAISLSQRAELSYKYRVAPDKKIKIVQNGFDLTTYISQNRELWRKNFGLAPDEFAVVWAGRMAPVKDIHLLGQVIRKIAASSKKVRFVIVGDGEERLTLLNLIQGCANVTLLGWRQHIEHIWSAADAAILTSRNEGTPTSLIEAMAAGVPWISTHVGGVEDLAAGLLREMPNDFGFRAENGFLSARTPEAMCYCIEQLLSNARLSKEMGAVGRTFVMERFSSRRLVHEMELIYHTLIEQNCRSYTAVSQIETVAPHPEGGGL